MQEDRALALARCINLACTRLNYWVPASPVAVHVALTWREANNREHAQARTV